jgi:arylsulfatase A-like enzyme
MKLPSSSERKVIEEHVNLVDIMPTVLDTLNINPPVQTEGKSLWKKNRLLTQVRSLLLGKNGDEHYSFTELGRKFDLKAVVTSEWKYVYNYKNKKEQLFNIKDDSKELNNLVQKATKKKDELKDILFNWVSHPKKYPPKSQIIKLSQEEKEQLEALGYLQTQ